MRRPKMQLGNRQGHKALSTYLVTGVPLTLVFEVGTCLLQYLAFLKSICSINLACADLCRLFPAYVE